MKKMKLVSLLALLLVVIMAFSSCALGKVSIKKWINADAEYEENTVFQTMEKVGSLSDNYEWVDYRRQLVYLAETTSDTPSYTVHVVYDLATNQVVKKVTDSARASYTVSLGSAEQDDETIPFFSITHTSWDLGENDAHINIAYNTTVYSANGTEIASQADNKTPEVYCDLLYFNGKYYRANEDGTITEAFSNPAYAKRPDVSVKYDGKYYEFSNDYMFSVYNEELKLLSSYKFNPGSWVDQRPLGSVILENGNLLIQYITKLHDTNEDFSFTMIDEDESIVKVLLHTVIIDADNGKEKEIDTNYLILEAYNAKVYYYSDDLTPVVVGYAVEFDEDFILSEDLEDEDAVMVSINNRGKVKELAPFEDQVVTDIYRVNKTYWAVKTLSGYTYLVDQKGKLVGDITNATYRMDSFFVADGIIYSWEFEELYNFKAENYTIKTSFDDSLLLESSDGSLAVFVDGRTTVLKSSRDKMNFVSCSVAGVIVLKDTTNSEKPVYKLYNEKGIYIGSVDVNNYNQYTCSVIGSYNGNGLLHTYDDEGDHVYYRLSK